MNEGQTGGDGISTGRPMDAPPIQNKLRVLDINVDPQEYGQRAGEGFQALFDTWPQNIDKTKIRPEGRIDSPTSFWGVWNEAETIVMSDENKGVRQKILADKGGDDVLKTTINAARTNLEPLIQAAEAARSTDPRSYFAPFNADPVTCDISDGNNATVTYKDMGNVGEARNRVLAEVAAASNFYGRLWEKPEAQQAFLKGLLSGASSPQELNRRATIARSVATFGTIYLSKYAMNPTHSEHLMAKELLSSLQGNLGALQSAYESKLASRT